MEFRSRKLSGEQVQEALVMYKAGLMSIRGLLCPQCNTGLGFLHDDPFIIKRAQDYLKGELLHV